MNEPSVHMYQQHCLFKSETLTDDYMSENMTTDTMKVRDDHHPAYSSDGSPEPSEKNFFKSSSSSAR
jgi:hypothetical protein